jgi:hypothetical protein
MQENRDGIRPSHHQHVVLFEMASGYLLIRRFRQQRFGKMPRVSNAYTAAHGRTVMYRTVLLMQKAGWIEPCEPYGWKITSLGKRMVA